NAKRRTNFKKRSFIQYDRTTQIFKTMKKFTSLFLFMALLWVASADAQSQKITFVEHFSNTHCPICQSNRSKVENDLEKYKDEVNTMTIHRKYPYSICPLYQYAK